MPTALVFPVEPIDVACSDAPEYLAQRLNSFFDEQMQMIVKETISIKLKAGELFDFT
jgi:hypothetical protein